MELAARLALDRLYNHCAGHRLWGSRLRRHDAGFVRRHQRHDRPVVRARLKRHRHALFGRGLLAVRLLGAQRQLVSAWRKPGRDHGELSGLIRDRAIMQLAVA